MYPKRYKITSIKKKSENIKRTKQTLNDMNNISVYILSILVLATPCLLTDFCNRAHNPLIYRSIPLKLSLVMHLWPLHFLYPFWGSYPLQGLANFHSTSILTNHTVPLGHLILLLVLNLFSSLNCLPMYSDSSPHIQQLWLCSMLHSKLGKNTLQSSFYPPPWIPIYSLLQSTANRQSLCKSSCGQK